MAQQQAEAAQAAQAEGNGQQAVDGVDGEQVVTPWEVQGGADGAINYDKLVDEFGCQRISPDLLERIERVTGKSAHPFLRRGMFFAHRDMEELLTWHEQGNPFYLYTGRGPSSEAMHLGHLVPFLFTKWLQEAFKVPLVIQITDDEKFLWKENIESPEEAHRLARENIRDIIACGFDLDRTFIFSDFAYTSPSFKRLISRIQKATTGNQVRGAFGLTLEANIGQLQFPAVQAAPSFPEAFPHIFRGMKEVKCLIPCAIDQDPYFRITRGIAPRLGFHKPALIESKFFPALQGDSGKMSASSASSAIFLTDTPKQIKDKVSKHAFSGGGATLEEHKEKGANLAVDVTFKYLTFFCSDDEQLAHVEQEYGSGRMTTATEKGILIDILTDMVSRHQRLRSQVTDDIVDAFLSPRPMFDKLYS